MIKKKIGDDLKSQLRKGYDIVRISNWAFRFFSDHVRELDANSREVLECLFSMEDDPQFEFSETELNILAEELQKEGNNPLDKIRKAK